MSDSKNNAFLTLEFGASYKAVKIGDIAYIACDKPMKLECGVEISKVPIAYQTYGKLNKDKSNAILICHGLTGDQYLIGKHPVTGKDGWWQMVAGQKKQIDTENFFVICPNMLGSCLGSFSPKSINPKTGKTYGLDFPIITIADMAQACARLVQEIFGINRLNSVIGGSMGGMVALTMSSLYPNIAKNIVAIATSYRHSTQNIAFNEVGRRAIMADEGWASGNYIQQRSFPTNGLAIARMMAHITYLSEGGLHHKFGRNLQDRQKISYGFEADFQIESYLRHQGKSFVERFDANSYLYITRAMDYFDLSISNGYEKFNGNLSQAFAGSQSEFFIISLSSDWLFPTEESKKITHALMSANKKVSFTEVKTEKGHDGFLIEGEDFSRILAAVMQKIQSQEDGV